MYRWFGESTSFVLCVRLSVCTTVHLCDCERGVHVSVFRFASLCGHTPAHPKIPRGPGHCQPVLATPNALPGSARPTLPCSQGRARQPSLENMPGAPQLRMSPRHLNRPRPGLQVGLD